MAAIQIPCPKCDAELRLPDRKLLGRRGKCPQCQHRFILEEPEEVELELVQESPVLTESQPAGATPPLGTAARWVPDQPADAEFLARLHAAGSSQPIEFPECIPGSLSVEEDVPFAESAEEATVPKVTDKVPVDGPAAAGTPEETAKSRKKSRKAEPAPESPKAAAGGSSRVHGMRRRNQRRQRAMLFAGGAVTMLLLAITVGVFMFGSPSTDPKPKKSGASPVQPIADNNVDVVEETVASVAAGPTSGKPIDLLYFPSGARLIAHLHPAVLWQKNRQFNEFRGCLNPIDASLDTFVRDLTRVEPAEIEELTIAVGLISRGTPAELSAKVRLTNEFKRTDLIRRFNGQRSDTHSQEVYLTETQAWLLLDNRTFVVGPVEHVEEMLRAESYANQTASGVEEILKLTDRDRQITVVFEPQDFVIHAESLFPENLRELASAVTDWFGEDVETATVSLHLDDSELFLESQIRNHFVTSPRSLARTVRTQLRDLSKEIGEYLATLQPGQPGRAQLIERFPEMLRVLSSSISVTEGTRQLTLSGTLPERAAPNLALASVLSWAEQHQAGSGVVVTAAKPEQKPSASVAERLRRPIDIDFNRTPLREAFEFIGDEVDVAIVMNGDALKLSGYTQNMPQTLQLGQAPATKVIGEILKKYDEMIIVVDEQNGQVTVTTRDVAAEAGLEAFPVN